MKNDDANDQTAQDLVDSIFGSIPEKQERPSSDSITEDQLFDRVTKDASEIITSGLDAIASIKDRIGTAADSDTIEAFSTLISSTTAAIEVLNKLQIQTKKAKDAEKLEELRHKHKTEQINQRSKLMLGDGQPINNNILIATREDIMNSLLKPLQEQARIMVSNEPQIVDVFPHQQEGSNA